MNFVDPIDYGFSYAVTNTPDNAPQQVHFSPPSPERDAPPDMERPAPLKTVHMKRRLPHRYRDDEFEYKYSEGESDGDEDRHVVLREAVKLADELNGDGSYISVGFLIFWLAKYLLGYCGCGGYAWVDAVRASAHEQTKLGQHHAEKMYHRSAAVRRMVRMLLWMTFVLAAQIIIYVGLMWGIVKGAQEFDDRTGNSLCPGQDDNSWRSDWATTSVNPDNYKANMPQVITFAGLMVLMAARVIYDWIISNRMYMTVVRSIAPDSWLKTYGLRPATRRFFICLQRRYKLLVCIDFYMHVVMRTLICGITIWVLFYITSVGKMLAIGFCLEFLELQDDKAKAESLAYTPLAQWLFATENAYHRALLDTESHICRERHSDGSSKFGCAVLYIGEFIYHILYFFVLGMVVFAIVWLGRGCKPGKLNALDYF